MFHYKMPFGFTIICMWFCFTEDCTGELPGKRNAHAKANSINDVIQFLKETFIVAEQLRIVNLSGNICHKPRGHNQNRVTVVLFTNKMLIFEPVEILYKHWYSTFNLYNNDLI